jgi:hypothetical protein
MSNLGILNRRPNPAGLSIGTLAMAGIGLALYQLTSLELGTAGHDIRVNLNLDAPVMQDVAQPLEKADAALGQVMVVLQRTPDRVRGPRTASNAATTATASRPSTAPTSSSALPRVQSVPGHTLPVVTAAHQGLPANAPPSPTSYPVTPSSTTAPAQTGQPAVPAASPAKPAPIIGRCQNSSTGWLSETSPSIGVADAAMGSPCLEAGERD